MTRVLHKHERAAEIKGFNQKWHQQSAWIKNVTFETVEFVLLKWDFVMGRANNFGTHQWFHFKTISTKSSKITQLSHGKKKTLTFQYAGCLIGIPIMVHYNPHMTPEISQKCQHLYELLRLTSRSISHDDSSKYATIAACNEQICPFTVALFEHTIKHEVILHASVLYILPVYSPSIPLPWNKVLRGPNYQLVV